MEFFDCNCCIGLPKVAPLRPLATAADLLATMDRAGVARALVWHVAQRDVFAVKGNELLAEAIAPHADRLVGCWTILPGACGELPAPPEFCEQMARAGVKALRAQPGDHRYLLNAVACGDILEEMVARRIPLLLSLGAAGVDWPGVYALLAEFPELTCVLCELGLWGADRLFRPLLQRYPNVHIETSEYIPEGGIEDLIAFCGPKRILFGSGLPQRDPGGQLLAIRHADIAEADKALIAGGNVERILSQVKL